MLRRRQLTDFERFKVMKLRKQVGLLLICLLVGSVGDTRPFSGWIHGLDDYMAATVKALWKISTKIGHTLSLNWLMSSSPIGTFRGPEDFRKGAVVGEEIESGLSGRSCQKPSIDGRPTRRFCRYSSGGCSSWSSHIMYYGQTTSVSRRNVNNPRFSAFMHSISP